MNEIFICELCMTDVFDGIIPVCDIIRQHDDDNYYCSHEFASLISFITARIAILSA